MVPNPASVLGNSRSVVSTKAVCLHCNCIFWGFNTQPPKIGCVTPGKLERHTRGVAQPKNCRDWGSRNKFKKKIYFFFINFFGGHNEIYFMILNFIPKFSGVKNLMVRFISLINLIFILLLVLSLIFWRNFFR